MIVFTVTIIIVYKKYNQRRNIPELPIPAGNKSISTGLATISEQFKYMINPPAYEKMQEYEEEKNMKFNLG